MEIEEDTRTDEEIIKNLTEGLIIVHRNLVGQGTDAWKPISVKFAHSLARYIERILEGESPQQIAENPVEEECEA
jgi:hypothetical protein